MVIFKYEGVVRKVVVKEILGKIMTLAEHWHTTSSDAGFSIVGTVSDFFYEKLKQTCYVLEYWAPDCLKIYCYSFFYTEIV